MTRSTERRSTGRAAIALAFLLLVLWCSSRNVGPNPAEPGEPVQDAAPCDRLIDQGARAGLVKERPAINRIDVEDQLWAIIPAGAKRGLALAVRCSALAGRPGAATDYAVVYGYRSGRRLAMATSVGVTFE